MSKKIVVPAMACYGISTTMLPLLLLFFVAGLAPAHAQVDPTSTVLTEGNSSGSAVMPSQKHSENISAKEMMTEWNSAGVTQQFSANTGYVAGGNAHAGGLGYGGLSEQSTNIGYGVTIPVNLIHLELGTDYSRFDFGNAGPGAALPQSLQNIAPYLGLKVPLSTEWGLFGRFIPEVEAVNNWDSLYVRYTGVVGASYTFSRDLDVSFGAIINPGVEYWPVLPLVAAKWHFADQWTVRLGFPKTDLEYQVTPKWMLSAGPSFLGGMYRTGSDYGTPFGRPDLNNQHVEYREIRVGLGSEYKLTSAISLEAELGASVYRQFNFVDDNYKVDADPAPYASIGAKVRF